MAQHIFNLVFCVFFLLNERWIHHRTQSKPYDHSKRELKPNEWIKKETKMKQIDMKRNGIIHVGTAFFTET